jgi:HAD superfamily hydrolase (TIGR01662 family)
MRVKAVLFDMFDTLMLIEKNHMFYQPALKRAHRFLVENGVDVGFVEFRHAYVKARDALYAVADVTLEEPHFNVRIAETLRSLGYEFDVNSPIVFGATSAFCEEFMAFVRIDDDTERVLRALHGRYRLGVVSNFAIPECVYRLLEQHGLDKLFDAVVVSAAVNKRKPSPEIFRKALQKLRVKASEAVFVGDTVDADIAGAKRVGMRTVYLERREQEAAEAVCPDQTIRGMRELPAAIERCL